MNGRSTPRREAARVAVLFVVSSLLWVVVSDRVALNLAGDDVALLATLQGWKGLAFIGVVAGLLYIVLRRTLERQASSESTLNALNADLEHRVAERTAQLESANRELEAFSYSVSHDLKAPLRGVDGYSQILLLDHAEQLDAEGRELIGNIRDGVAQMHALIEDMLAYSRIERRSLEARVIELSDIARSIIEQREAVEMVDQSRRPEIVCRLDGVEARVDREGFALAFRNLIENAIKFSRGRDQPRIKVDAEQQPGHVVLSVRDNGIGFDMQYHDRIFDIFQRLHRAEDYPGTGVGLALVKKAVSRMGGRVWAVSEVDRGATFFMELPK
jgi:signal transduction histidine kinase